MTALAEYRPSIRWAPNIRNVTIDISPCVIAKAAMDRVGLYRAHPTNHHHTTDKTSVHESPYKSAKATKQDVKSL
jgi:hypothetical protein